MLKLKKNQDLDKIFFKCLKYLKINKTVRESEAQVGGSKSPERGGQHWELPCPGASEILKEQLVFGSACWDKGTEVMPKAHPRWESYYHPSP